MNSRWNQAITVIAVASLCFGTFIYQAHAKDGEPKSYLKVKKGNECDWNDAGRITGYYENIKNNHTSKGIKATYDYKNSSGNTSSESQTISAGGTVRAGCGGTASITGGSWE